MPSCRFQEAQFIQNVRVVQLEQVPEEQERQKETQPSPHPRVETLDRDIHIVPFPECFQPIENALLVAELEILNDADVAIKQHKLVAEQAPRFCIGPN